MMERKRKELEDTRERKINTAQRIRNKQTTKLNKTEIKNK